MKKATLLFILLLGLTQFAFAQSTKNSSNRDKTKVTTSSTVQKKQHPTKNTQTDNNQFIVISIPPELKNTNRTVGKPPE